MDDDKRETEKTTESHGAALLVTQNPVDEEPCKVKRLWRRDDNNVIT